MSRNSGIGILSGSKLSDVEYADDFIFPHQYPCKRQVFFCCMHHNAYVWSAFGVLKCNILLRNWIGLKRNLILARMELCIVDKICYLSSCRWPYFGRSIPKCSEDSDGICQFEASIYLAQRRIIDQRSSLHRTSKSAPAIRFRALHQRLRNIAGVYQ